MYGGGYLGSYYWMHYGSNHPEETVSKLIQYIMEENNLTTLITCGSSKGGTAAIYFGLKHNAKKIYSGASQFLVGSYLDREEHREILLGMIGTCEKDKKVEELNSKISKEIEKHLESTAINLFYSTRELTYERQILPLKKYLDAKKVKYKETIVDFEDHASVGSYFPHFVLHELKDFI